MKQKWIAAAALFSFFMTFSSLVHAQAEQFVDTITVVDYWVRVAGSFTLGGGGGGAGGSVASSEEATIRMAMERIARCDAMRAAYAQAGCFGKGSAAPDLFNLGIPDTKYGLAVYSTRLAWQSTILEYANLLYSYPSTDVARAAAGVALRGSLAACGSGVTCQNEVLQYFGVNPTTVQYNLSGLVDLNAAFNGVLNALGFGVGFAASDAGSLVPKFYAVQFCQGILTQARNVQNRCSL